MAFAVLFGKIWTFIDCHLEHWDLAKEKFSLFPKAQMYFLFAGFFVLSRNLWSSDPGASVQLPYFLSFMYSYSGGCSGFIACLNIG